MMPTERQLQEVGLSDVLAAIKVSHGGLGVVARKFGLRLQGPGSRSALRRAGFFRDGITESAVI